MIHTLSEFTYSLHNFLIKKVQELLSFRKLLLKMNNENKSMTFPKEQIWNLYRKLRIGFEEIRKYAFAYIKTVRQGLQGIFSETLVNRIFASRGII